MRWLRLIILYQVGAIATFIYLMFFDRMPHEWGRWIIVAILNGFFAEIWPLYWIVPRLLF